MEEGSDNNILAMISQSSMCISFLEAATIHLDATAWSENLIRAARFGSCESALCWKSEACSIAASLQISVMYLANCGSSCFGRFRSR